MKKKTIEQWLKASLTPEQFENASNNKYFIEWDSFCDKLSYAINHGFDWNTMPEGYDYWSKKYDDLISKGL